MDKKNYYLTLLEIDQWRRKAAPNIQHSSPRISPTPTKVEDAMAKPTSELDWEELAARVKNCTACDLYKTRTQTVFGVGDRNADLLIIGEAPGANEDKQGEPFVGRAGKLLNSMLNSIELSREKVYIANIVKSRPPNNRDPKPEEVAACTPYLTRQIALIQPKLILALGRIAAHFLLSTDAAMGSLRGRQFKYGERQTPLIVTYHPAYLLRAPREKRKVWDDLQLVMDVIKR